MLWCNNMPNMCFFASMAGEGIKFIKMYAAHSFGAVAYVISAPNCLSLGRFSRA